MNTIFQNEHLLPGQIGHLLIIVAFVAALFSAISYFCATKETAQNLTNSSSWHKIGRIAFTFHAFSVVAVFGVLSYIITQHLFEYHYAWQHSSLKMPLKYLLSCFWEGQEGSFLLWAFWHAALGLIVMRTSGKLETSVMAIIAAVQALLMSTVLGFHLSEGVQIGSNPFILLREYMVGAPIFLQADYLNFIKDGNGLNILLQNYWMTIHPPVLFLGFAATLIPFSFVMAALWKGDYQLFVKPARLWSLWAGGILGLGIMMGGAWAYESLTFGGYWAWDPVENASLVPWLTLVAGLHLLIIYNATGRNLRLTFLFLLLTHILVWYATFLTRTGILGDTSVHAFTGEGKSIYWHLLFILGLIITGSFSLLFYRWKKIPTIKSEEDMSSREFWMFIGAFILFISSLHIIIVTSLPVWAPLAKKLTGKDFAPPLNPVQSYNSLQVWIAIALGMLSSSVLFLKFKKSDTLAAWRKIGLSILFATALALLIGITQKINQWQYALYLWAACWGLIASAYYAFFVQQGKWKKKGAALSHFGFATILLGILLSSFNKEVISFNTTGMPLELGKKNAMEALKESRENVMLFKTVPVAMGDYFATYMGDSISDKDPRTFFKIHYEKIEAKTHKVTEQFNLYPDAFINPKGQSGLSANPASKHYLTKDIFTYVTSVLDKSKVIDTHAFINHLVKMGDTIFVQKGFLVLENFKGSLKNYQLIKQPEDEAVMAANLKAFNLGGLVDSLSPIFILRGHEIVTIDDTLKNWGLYTHFSNIYPEKKTMEIGTKEISPTEDYIIMKALVFPYINVLWLGVILMVAGFLLSIYHRVTKLD